MNSNHLNFIKELNYLPVGLGKDDFSKEFYRDNTKSNLILLLNYFKDFCEENDLNWDNVELLGILQYIGICTLYKDFHEGKYGEFLFLLGKYLLTKKLNNDRIS